MPIVINGSAGTVTGISTGGLPDGCVDTDTLANNAVTSAKSTIQSKLIQVVSNDITSGSNIGSNASNPTDTGLITIVTTQGAGSSFIVSSVGANPHCNAGANNRGIKLYLYASVAGGSYASVYGAGVPFMALYTTTSWIDYNGSWTCHVTGLSYSVGNTIAFQPYYSQGNDNSGSTNYYHHTGGTGGDGRIRLTVQEIAA